jgi:hypothetical protein
MCILEDNIKMYLRVVRYAVLWTGIIWTKNGNIGRLSENSNRFLAFAKRAERLHEQGDHQVFKCIVCLGVSVVSVIRF